MFFLQYKKGYSLIEVLIATSILLISILGPLTIASQGIQTGQYIRERAVATFLAQEGVETVVALRNSSIIKAVAAGDLSQSWDWQSSIPGIDACFPERGTTVGCNMDFATPTIHPCYSSEDCVLQSDSTEDIPYQANGGGADSPFMRVITLENIAPKEVRITSTVYWNSSLNTGGDLAQVAFYSSVFSLYE